MLRRHETPQTDEAADLNAVTGQAVPWGARLGKAHCVHDELLADGSMVLYNACRQQILTINPTAALVWEYCDGEHDVAAIIAELREVFPSAPEHDIYELLTSFYQSGMLAITVPE